VSISWDTVERALQAWVVGGSGLPGNQVVWAGQNAARPDDPWISLNVTYIGGVGQDWADKKYRNFVYSKAIAGADTGTGQLTVVAHGLATADGPLRVEQGGTLPAPLAQNVDYWPIVFDADHLKLAVAFLDALHNVPVVLTTNGIGVNTLVSTPQTARHGAELTRTARGARRAALTIQCFTRKATGNTNARAILERVRSARTLPARAYALRQAGVGVGKMNNIQFNGQVVSTTVFEPRAILEVEFFLASEVEETGTYIERAKITDQITDPSRDFTVG
jgi:hypothetical protein